MKIELDDGDFIHLEHYEKNAPHTIMLLHGLEGSGESHYILGLTKQLLIANFNVMVMHFRNCGKERNRLLKSYHSGVSDDLAEVIDKLEQENCYIDFLVGFSLGGNVLLKWLGEGSVHKSIKGAVAVSVPLLLNECADSINSGFSKLYQYHLLRSLKLKTLQKYPEIKSEVQINPSSMMKINCFYEFDNLITAPLGGFSSANEYYRQCSSRQFLMNIKVPTLIIHALDDPFMNDKVIPNECELSESVTLEISEHGGHVGFITNNGIGMPKYYLDGRICEYFNHLKSDGCNS